MRPVSTGGIILTKPSQTLKIMKLKINWLVVALIAAVIFLFYQWQCQKVTSPVNDKKQVDSLKQAVKVVQWASDHNTDSIKRDNEILKMFAENAQGENDMLTDSITRIRGKIRIMQTDLMLKPDTIGLIDPECANLSDAFDQYITMTDTKEKLQDSTIVTLKGIIKNDSSIISDREAFNAMLKQSFSTVGDKYNSLYKSFGSEQKKLQWFKIKEKAYWGGLIFMGGKILFDSIKK